MLEHLHILYFFITLLIGSISCVIGIFFYLKTKEKLILYYLYFYIAYTLMIFLGLFDLYIRTNVPNLPSIIEHISSYFMEFPVLYFLMFTIPFYSHYIFSAPRANAKNKILGFVILLAFVGQHFTEMLFGGSVDSIGDVIEDILLIYVVLYSAVMGLVFYRRITDTIRKTFAFYFLLLLWIYIPGIIADTLYDGFFSLEFYPTLYCGYSIVYTHLIIKHFTHIPLERLQLTISQDFITKHNISSRETEILSLILQGKSNKQIGDKLFISQSTVKTHISNLFNKCRVKSRYALITLLSKISTVEE